ncbi:hypothetical protein ACYUJ6_12835 [Clostridium sp. JNZ X4-2]
MDKDLNNQFFFQSYRKQIEHSLQILMGENKLDEAYDTLNKGLKINPLDVNLLYALANLYEIENKHNMKAVGGMKPILSITVKHSIFPFGVKAWKLLKV